MNLLGLLVEQYLAFAETMANQHIPMYMKDWIEKLDDILKMNKIFPYYLWFGGGAVTSGTYKGEKYFVENDPALRYEMIEYKTFGFPLEVQLEYFDRPAALTIKKPPFIYLAIPVYIAYIRSTLF